MKREVLCGELTATFDAVSVVGHRQRGEGVSGFSIEGVRARVSTDHLEAEAREAWLQFARNLLERFGGDLSAGGPQRGYACPNAVHCAISALARPLLQVREGVANVRIGHSQASAAGNDDLSFQGGVQLPSRSASAKSTISLRSCLSSAIRRLRSRAPARSPRAPA